MSGLRDHWRIGILSCMVCIVDSSSGLGLTWNISHHAGVHIVAVLWLALSLVGGGELEGVILAAYANREGRARLHVLFVSS